MASVTVHHDVFVPFDSGYQLHLQWVTYHYDDSVDTEDGYRFIWSDSTGSLRPARGQARIPSSAVLFNLLAKASEAGWFGTAENGTTAPLIRPTGV